MRVSFIIFEHILLWTIVKVTNNEAIVFKMTNAVCKSYNESWVTIQTCRLKAVSRNITTMNFYGTILHPTYDVRVKGQMFKKANGYKPWLYKYEIDCCKFIKHAYNPVAIIVFKLFKEFTNVNHECPFMGPQIMDGFHLRSDLLPHTIPTGEYMVSLTWLFHKKPQFFTNVYYVFEENLI